MPWRDDFTKSYWMDPDYQGLAGYPDDSGRVPEPEAPRAPRNRPAPNHVTTEHLQYRRSNPTTNPLGAAIIVIRDRIGFEYERQVGLEDFVSIREASQLLELPVMTLSRWVKGKRIKSSKRKGFVVIQLKEVLRVLKERGTDPKVGFRMITIG